MKFLASRSAAAARGSAPREFLTARRHLTIAELRSIGTNPIELVPSPGPGRVIVPICCLAWGEGGVGYSGGLTFLYGSDPDVAGQIMSGADSMTGWDRPFLTLLLPADQRDVLANEGLFLSTMDGEDMTGGDYEIDLRFEYEIVKL